MSERGFTLIEVMVVIVVMGVVASLVVMNFSGLDRRKAMQAREVLILDLKHIHRLANEQAQVLALDFKVQQQGTVYQVLQYQPEASELKAKWQPMQVFQAKTLPDAVRVKVTPIEQSYQNAGNLELLDAKAPQLMWLGNGEVKPVRIQLYFEEQPLGQEIEIDYLGKVHES